MLQIPNVVNIMYIMPDVNSCLPCLKDLYKQAVKRANCIFIRLLSEITMVTTSVKRMTHFLSASIAIALTVSLVGCGGAETNTDIAAVDVSTSVDDWRLVWSDEFDGTSIDSSNWTHEVNCDGGGNQEQQCYTDSAENSFVTDGMLNIMAKPSTNGEALPYTSARMVTKNQADFTYGRFEMRAKLPFGQGTWPAFWMLSTDEVYGTWPKSGEIDIMEAVNLKELGADGEVERSIVGTLYYGDGVPDENRQFDSTGKTFDLLDGSNPADDFHTYAIEWQEGEIRWYVDGYLYSTQRMSELNINSRGVVQGLKHKGWYAEFFDFLTGDLETDWSAAPFDQDFHMILNLAVGGAFPANTNNAANFNNGIDPAALADGQTFLIDYVRVYSCSANPSDGSGCENIRNGYDVVATDAKPTGALLIGEAPTPQPPIGPNVGITIFDDDEDAGWPLWSGDANGGSENSLKTVVVDDDPIYGAVAEFEILDSVGVVLGFNTRESEEPETFNASGLLAQGTFSFDMKVVTAPDATSDWFLKIESDAGNSAADLMLQNSIEGQSPVEGVWQTYTFTVQSLVDAGLQLGLIDIIMIFPEYAQGEGAVYRVDNVKFNKGAVTGGPTIPPLEVFDDAENPLWSLWDSSGSTTPGVVDDAENGVVAEFSVFDNAGAVFGFNSRTEFSPNGVPFNAEALKNAGGTLSLKMKIENQPNAASTWTLKLEANNDASTGFVEVNLNTSDEGVDPVPGVWQTYTFSLIDLEAAGLDVLAIDLIMIFPSWGISEGTVFRVDNVVIGD